MKKKTIKQVNVSLYLEDWRKFVKKWENASSRLRKLIELDLQNRIGE